ncbi:MAG: hypothetical protein OXC92_02380, partial [Flavobacteriaceae bacterium]|nr:hypothetical protein [Flavobacteriaceae bacterium]
SYGDGVDVGGSRLTRAEEERIMDWFFGFVPPTDLNNSTGGATVFGVGSALINELPIAKTNPRKSSLPKAGSDIVKADSGPKDLDRLGWL